MAKKKDDAKHGAEVAEIGAPARFLPGTPAATLKGATVTYSLQRADYCEVRFAEKPDEATRERCKALGLRWARTRATWYGPIARLGVPPQHPAPVTEHEKRIDVEHAAAVAQTSQAATDAYVFGLDTPAPAHPDFLTPPMKTEEEHDADAIADERRAQLREDHDPRELDDERAEQALRGAPHESPGVDWLDPRD